MKLVASPDDLAGAWAVASSEAEAAFGDGTVFLERYVRDAKHVEVQVLGDGTGTVCTSGSASAPSISATEGVEEAPCVALPERPDRCCTAALWPSRTRWTTAAWARSSFLYDVERQQVSFLEVNPRLQVEHSGDRGDHRCRPGP
jgi:acetyl-CoA carboxylase biotin carboxylase subunit